MPFGYPDQVDREYVYLLNLPFDKISSDTGGNYSEIAGKSILLKIPYSNGNGYYHAIGTISQYISYTSAHIISMGGGTDPNKYTHNLNFGGPISWESFTPDPSVENPETLDGVPGTLKVIVKLDKSIQATFY